MLWHLARKHVPLPPVTYWSGLTPRSRSGMNQRYPASSGLLLHRMPDLPPSKNLDEAVQQLMGKLACIGERCRRWINTVCTAFGGWLSQATSAHSDRRAYRRYANNCGPRARSVTDVCLMTRLPVETVIRRLQAGPPDMATCWPGIYRRYRTSKRCCAPETVAKNRSAVYLMTRSISLPTNQRWRFGVRRSQETGYQARKMWINHLPVGPTAGIMRNVWDWNRRCSTPWRRFYNYRQLSPRFYLSSYRKPCSARR